MARSGWPAPPGDLGGQFRAGPAGQRHPGGGGQLAGQRDHRGPFQRADPPRPPGPGQVRQAVQAPGGEPARHSRTVSTLTCRSAAMRALARPRAAASTICARAIPGTRSCPRGTFTSCAHQHSA